MVASANTQTVHKIKFHHGLGDTLMFRNVLYLLGEPVALFLNPALGQDAIFYNDPLVHVVGDPEHPETFKEVLFHVENSRLCVGGRPTKVRICMEHEFGLVRPDFTIRPRPLDHLEGLDTQAISQTAQFLEGLDQYAICHFQGTSNPNAQNPDTGFASRTIAAILDRGYGVVIVNYDYIFHNPANSDFPFIDGDRVRSTYRRLPIAFESLWYLLRHAAFFVGVDSGPLHTAVCMDLPTIYLRKHTNFMEDFYDSRLEDVVTVDIRKADQAPSTLFDYLPNKNHSASTSQPTHSGSVEKKELDQAE